MYTAWCMCMCACAYESPQRHGRDATCAFTLRAVRLWQAFSFAERDVFGAVRLIESLLHNCKGRIDAILPDLVGMIMMRLSPADSGGRRSRMPSLAWPLMPGCVRRVA